MRRKDKKTLFIIGIFSIPIILGLIFNNCVMNLDFSGKCISEQISKGFQEGINKLVNIKVEHKTYKLNNLQENINRTPIF